MNINKITLKDIGGYEYQKEEANKIINFFKNYNKYVKEGAKLPRGVILYGQPGTGKTMFATAIANESNVNVYSLTESKFYNNKNISLSIHKIFDDAKKNAPSIILIDELDQLVNCLEFSMSSPSDKQSETLRVLLTEIDEIEQQGVLVIATSNAYIDSIPCSLTRNGRLEKHLLIDAPDFAERSSIINLYLNNNPLFKNINSNELAKITSGFVGSSLSSLINDVLIKCLTNKCKEAKYSDFYDPIQTIISGGIKNKPKKNNDDVIYHEIGHLISNYVIKNTVGMINTESYGLSSGRFYKVEVLGETECNPSTYDEYVEEAIISLSGLAATEVYLGKKYNGSFIDIQKAINLFRSLNLNGLSDLNLSVDVLLTRHETSNPGASSKKYMDEQYKFIKTCYEKAINILKSNKVLADKLFKTLKISKNLSSEEVKKIIDETEIVKNSNFEELNEETFINNSGVQTHSIVLNDINKYPQQTYKTLTNFTQLIIKNEFKEVTFRNNNNNLEIMTVSCEQNK